MNNKFHMYKSKKNTNYSELLESLNIKLFDTGLRDGLQNIDESEFDNYTTEKKIILYNNIIKNYKPDFIEVGSLVSKKFFPIFSDSIDIFKQIANRENHSNNNIFLLIPSLSKFDLTIDLDYCNFSFISSVSNVFQKKKYK